MNGLFNAMRPCQDSMPARPGDTIEVFDHEARHHDDQLPVTLVAGTKLVFTNLEPHQRNRYGIDNENGAVLAEQPEDGQTVLGVIFEACGKFVPWDALRGLIALIVTVPDADRGRYVGNSTFDLPPARRFGIDFSDTAPAAT